MLEKSNKESYMRSSGQRSSVRITSVVSYLVLLASCGGGHNDTGAANSGVAKSSDGASTTTGVQLNAIVSGLQGTGLSVTVNRGTPIPINVNGTQQLTTALVEGTQYLVDVATDPGNGQDCIVQNGSGTISHNNSPVTVICDLPNAHANIVSAQSTFTAGVEGTLSVTDVQNPLFGAQIAIAADALADATDTLSIGYSNGLPAPLDPIATTHGIIPIGKTVNLNRTGISPFAQALIVTVPYYAGLLNSNDVPVVVYWDESQNRYEPVQVISVNHTAGTVTFVTKHFSSFVITALKGLSDFLRGSANPASTPSVLLSADDTGFRPALDGFEVQNFSTQYKDGSRGGACYGLTSYAAWYFNKKPSATRLFEKYKASSLATNPHIPQQDGLARELIHETWTATYGSRFSTAIHAQEALRSPDRHLLTATQLVLQLELTHEPQLVAIFDSAEPHTASGHSILVYKAEGGGSTVPGAMQFYVYDPNYPGQEVLPLTWNPASGFDAFVSGETAFPYIIFDAPGSHSKQDVQLRKIYDDAEAGLSSPSFNNLSIIAPAPVTIRKYPMASSYRLAAQGNTDFTATWNCDPADTNLPKDGCTPSYFHAFLDSVPMGPAQLIQRGAPFHLVIPPLPSASHELLLAVTRNNANTLDQQDFSYGYDAFIRIELMPANAAQLFNYYYNFSANGLQCGQSVSISFSGAIAGKTISDSASYTADTCVGFGRFSTAPIAAGNSSRSTDFGGFTFTSTSHVPSYFPDSADQAECWFELHALNSAGEDVIPFGVGSWHADCKSGTW
jgi:hypothetical protein